MSEDVIGNTIAAIAARGIANQPKSDLDYVGEDGLLVCGICHEKKRMLVDIAGTEGKRKVLVARQCKCEREAFELVKDAEATKKKEEHIDQLRKASLMDPRLSKATFDSFTATKYNAKNLRIVKKYVELFDQFESKGQGLLLWGDVGTGKSFAAACIANALLEREVSVMMVSFAAFIDMDASAAVDFIKQIERTRLVIFDDLGAERDTGYALEKVYRLIDGRCGSEMPMLLTTNLTIQQMMDEPDTRYRRIYDRIFECCHPVQFTGPSFRKKNAGSRFEEMQRLLEE